MNKSKQTIAILILSVICIILLGFRVQHTGRITYIFLIWNLFLAFIPYGISLKMDVSKSKWKLLAYGGIWLAFFPNAPYLITDFVHLPHRTSPTFWIDLSLLTMFSVAGFMLATLSLKKVHQVLHQFFNRLISNVILINLILLSGFGIYLGRILRWNSWDIVTNPKGLFVDIVHIFQSKKMLFEAGGFTLLFGLLIGSVYYSYHLTINKETVSN